ncbi:MAG TPA: outer membrane lipid asymmetry maintenance protein MlaD [Alphaproteobacteria bacterium]|nr:outer membrane lipid asymmetry maintenance protein MlaD [Alphaproteobacteria bacterium]HAJ45198.1 outer membrane lipid asymmetry maintenance protein MlaD [Alphaproteobacteria bacterium]
MQGNLVETLIGLAVIVIAAAFFYYAAATTGSADRGGYELVARFDRVDGISVGSDVRVSGIKVGTVAAQELDNQYRARVKLTIRDQVQIPDDSSIKITSESLLGGSYLSISPGGSDVMLKPGNEFGSTQGAIDIIGLLSRAFMGGSSTPAPSPTTPSAPAP